MNEEMNAVASLEEAGAAKNNSNTIAFAVGGAMLAVGAGLGYLLGSRKGIKKGEEAAKTAMKEEVDNLRNTVAGMKEAATS